jgi:hypothetical protein
MSGEPVYVTMLGRSVWALLNSYYAVLRDGGFQPKKIIVFGEEVFSDQKPQVQEGLRIISEEFGLTPTIKFELMKEADFIEAGKRISLLIKESKEAHNPVAIDITPGRKAMVAGALVPLAKIDVDHVFYLLIKSLDDAAKPYMMIPYQNQQLKDFKEPAPGVKI